MVYRFILPLLLALPLSNTAHSEAGMIPMDSPPGEIGGRGHWYTLRTMKGDLFWSDPSTNTDVRENENGTYSIAGEVPLSIALVLHPEFDENEPWRKAINWVREAEQIFRNSGVPVRFIIESIEIDPDMPNSVQSAFYDMTPRAPTYGYPDSGADMTVGLMTDKYGDSLCGIANMGRYNYYGGSIKSMTRCGPETLAHELGHNFGLEHDFETAEDANKGYCIEGNSGNFESCRKGTIMSYTRDRVPFFSNAMFKYDGLPLGDENSDAVTWLKEVLAGRALAYELDQQRDLDTNNTYEEETAYCK